MRSFGQKQVTFTLYQAKNLFKIIGTDSQGIQVFVDGPRLLQRQKASGRLALHSSFLTTTTDPAWRSLGIYQEVFQIYTESIPNLEIMSLISENQEMLSFASKIELFFRSPTAASSLLDSPATLKYLSQMGVSVYSSGFSAQDIQRAKDALLNLSIQGRAKLRAGWDTQQDQSVFGRFWSKRLSLEEKRNAEDALLTFGLELKSELENQTSDVLNQLFPFSYLEFIRKSQSNPKTCTSLAAG